MSQGIELTSTSSRRLARKKSVTTSTSRGGGISSNSDWRKKVTPENVLIALLLLSGVIYVYTTVFASEEDNGARKRKCVTNADCTPGTETCSAEKECVPLKPVDDDVVVVLTPTEKEAVRLKFTKNQLYSDPKNPTGGGASTGVTMEACQASCQGDDSCGGVVWKDSRGGMCYQTKTPTAAVSAEAATAYWRPSIPHPSVATSYAWRKPGTL